MDFTGTVISNPFDIEKHFKILHDDDFLFFLFIDFIGMTLVYGCDYFLNMCWFLNIPI